MSTDTYNKVFSMHGIVMIFLFLVPSVPATLGNFLIPIMIGAKDLAFPKINLLSWYIYMAGGTLALIAMVTGGVDTGWTFTTPMSTHFPNIRIFYKHDHTAELSEVPEGKADELGTQLVRGGRVGRGDCCLRQCVLSRSRAASARRRSGRKSSKSGRKLRYK
jgi:hypothetical protein